MSLLLMVILVGVSLSALIVPMVISQNRTTRFDTTRVQSLDAAQAGVDVALGLIRGAVTVDSTGISYGDSSKLPCGPLSGIVNATGSTSGPGAAAYTTTIEYFTSDPVVVTKAAMNCVAGYGVYDPGTASYTPGFARITSTGTVGAAVNGSSAGRTLVTTYAFKKTSPTIPGGTIQLNSSTVVLCMDAGSATPSAGTAVVLQACSNLTAPTAQQVFAYRSDLTLQLLSSVGAATANDPGLCLAPSASPPAANNGIVLSQCSALGSAPYNQQWSYNVYNGTGKFEASLPNSPRDGGLAGLCMSAPAQSATVPLTLATCATASAWLPATSVGPGAAAPPTTPGGPVTSVQWVNFSEFSRCLNVPNGDINASHLVDSACRQNPYSNTTTPVQKFTAPAIAAGRTNATGQIYTTVTGSTTMYCLTSPGTNRGYVTLGPQGNGGVQPCGAAGATQTWTIYDGDRSLSYAAKYTIVDNTGHCLGLTAPATGEPWSAVDVETCTGAANQKWNASAIVLNPSLQNTREK